MIYTNVRSSQQLNQSSLKTICQILDYGDEISNDISAYEHREFLFELTVVFADAMAAVWKPKSLIDSMENILNPPVMPLLEGYERLHLRAIADFSP